MCILMSVFTIETTSLWWNVLPSTSSLMFITILQNFSPPTVFLSPIPCCRVNFAPSWKSRSSPSGSKCENVLILGLHYSLLFSSRQGYSLLSTWLQISSLHRRSLVIAAYVNTFFDSNFSPFHHALEARNVKNFSSRFIIVIASTIFDELLWNTCPLSLLHEVCWDGNPALMEEKSNLRSFHIGVDIVPSNIISFLISPHNYFTLSYSLSIHLSWSPHHAAHFYTPL